MGMKFPNKNDQNGMNFGERDFAYKDRLDDIGINVKDFGAVGDGVTDDSEAFQSAIDLGGNILIPHSNSTYVINSPLIITKKTTIEGVGNVVLQATTLYFNESGGEYTIGNENVFTSIGVNGITLKNITIKGSYETSMGKQPRGSVPTYDLGKKLLYFYQCSNVQLVDFTLLNTFSSGVPLRIDYETEQKDVYGYNQILISESNNIDLKRCSWVDSTGEAWQIYNCTNVTVDNANMVLDYVTSMLDATYCDGVKIKNSYFERLQESTSGTLLNMASKNIKINNNTIRNSKIDIGNEYLNRQIPLGQSFFLENQEVFNNILINSTIEMSTTSNTFNLPFAQDTVKIHDNTFDYNLDTIPDYNGDVLKRMTFILLPVYHNCKNIEVYNNTIIARGTLLGVGLNRLRCIDMNSSLTTYERENIIIKDNNISINFDNFDFSFFETIATIYMKNGYSDNLEISNNNIDSPVGLYINNLENLESTVVSNNIASSSSFLTLSACDVILNLDINNNSFKFSPISGHTYTDSELYNLGYGGFVVGKLGATASISNVSICKNIVETAIFTYFSNTSTSISWSGSVSLMMNSVSFVDILTSGTVYGVRIGRTTSGNPTLNIKFSDEFYSNIGATNVSISIYHYLTLDLLRNNYRGNFNLVLSAWSNIGTLSGSYIVARDNIAIGTIASTTTNVELISTIMCLNNTYALNLNIENNHLTDEVFYDSTLNQFKAWDGTAYKIVAVS